MTDQYAGSPRYAAPPRSGGYASWGARVGAYLIDNVIPCTAVFVGMVLSPPETGPPPLTAIVLYVAAGVFAIWNIIFRQGRTGQTIGKQQLNIRLVSEATAQPIGAFKSFLRMLAHFFDGLCYIGYLWPLWDAKRQTFADKIMSTVVITDARHLT